MKPILAFVLLGIIASALPFYFTFDFPQFYRDLVYCEGNTNINIDGDTYPFSMIYIEGEDGMNIRNNTINAECIDSTTSK